MRAARRAVPRTVIRALVAAVVAVAGPVTVVAPAVAGPVMTSSPPGATPAALARASGHRVELTAQRTPTRQVWVNPDGTETSETSAQPRWVRRDGAWVDIDPTLARQADGTVAPKAASLGMTFSGGGDGPLAVLSAGGQSVTTTWPGRLPAPVLGGASATYPQVLPGVDLRLTATGTGFSEVLVVASRQAAANPALRSLRFGARGDGVSVRGATDGGLSAVDGAGAEVFHSGTPQMWDSGQRRAVMSQRLGGGQVTLTPDTALLDAPGTAYPVYLDPDWSGSKQAWTYVDKEYASSSYGLSPSHPYAETGYYDPGVKRSFFRMDTDNVNGKHILSATFRIEETKSYGCGSTYKTRTDLYLTGGITSSTSWSNQPAWKTDLDNVTSDYGYGSCASGNVEFNTTAAVVSAAAGGWSNTTFGLRASNEGNVASWKGFDPASARIVITYNTPPSTPTSATTVPGTPCATGAGRPSLSTASLPAGAVASLQTQVYDPDGTLDDKGVQAQFAMNHLNTATGQWEAFASLSTPFAKSSTWRTAQAAMPELTEGESYSWQARAYDGTDASAWTPWCEFTVDNTPPDQLPRVSSADYPGGTDTAHGGVGQPGTFTLTAGGQESGVTGFRYALDDPSAPLQVTAPGGTATVALAPRHELHNTLYVWPVDQAGNVGSAMATYDFEVGPPADPVAHWALDETGGAAAADSAPGGHPLALTGGTSWTANGRVAGALHVDGASGVGTASGPVVHTDRSFSVSAWARITSTAHNSTIVSQRAGTTSGFVLYYSSGLNRWAFNMQETDGMNPVIDRAPSDQAPVLGAWTHLVGVFDATTHRLLLYVNGVLQSAPGTHTATWDATGALQVGRELYQGIEQNYLTGDVDDVKIYDRILSDLPADSAYGEADAEVYHLATRPVNQEGWWQLDETTGTGAADSSGHGRTATATGGAPGWDPDGRFGGAATLNGSTQSLGTAGPVLRTDGSFSVATWVRLDGTKLGGALPGSATAVSQDGVHDADFHLGLRSATETLPNGSTGSVSRWSFSMVSADLNSGRTVYSALSLPVDASVLNQWVLLVGVYDAPSRTIRLYVPGTGDTGSQVMPASWIPWQATGGLQLGRSKWTDSPVEYWPGQLDQVRAYSGVLTANDAANLFQDTTPTA